MIKDCISHHRRLIQMKFVERCKVLRQITCICYFLKQETLHSLKERLIRYADRHGITYFG